MNTLKKRHGKPFTTLNNVYISRSAILHNFDLLAAQQGKQLIPVLKSNAYGHGIQQVAEILEQRAPALIAVDGYHEALQIKDIVSPSILVLGAIDSSNYPNINFKNITPVVFTISDIKALGALKTPVTIHLEIDTGMRRHGVRPENLGELLEVLSVQKNITLGGVMTHLADSDNPDDETYTTQQITQFDTCIEAIKNAGFAPQYIHAGQSAGSTRDTSKYTNAIRPGIALYGLSPLEETDPNYSMFNELKPALTLTSRIGAVQHIKQGESVSYNKTFTAPQNMTLAIMPLGYYEAIPRRLSAHSQRFGAEATLPVVARICMNHHMLDITNHPYSVGDEIVIYSTNQNQGNSIQAISNKLAYTNAYEIMIAINQTIRRTIVD